MGKGESLGNSALVIGGIDAPDDTHMTVELKDPRIIDTLPLQQVKRNENVSGFT